MSKLLTGKDLKVGKCYAIVSEYSSGDVDGCELNMNTFVVETINEMGWLLASDVSFYGDSGVWGLFYVDTTKLTFIEVTECKDNIDTMQKQKESNMNIQPAKHLVAVYQDEFKATNMTYAGMSVDEIVSSMEEAGDDFRDFVFYDLTGLESKKIKLGLE